MAIAVSYLIQNIVVLVWIVSFFASDPLNYQKDGIQKQGLIPTSLWLTRLKNPMKQNIVWNTPTNSGVPAMPLFTQSYSSKEMSYKSNVHDFIETFTLTKDSDEQTLNLISKNYISPHTRAMVMMGCYGDPTTSAVLKSPAASSMASNKNTAFMLNIILQELENRYNPHEKNIVSSRETGQISNDRSACSCMKDFASPALMKASVSIGETKYSYDTCLMQNVVDYTSTPSGRQRVDPMLEELDAYKNVLDENYGKDATNNSRWKTVSIETAKADLPVIALLVSVLNTSDAVISPQSTLEQLVIKLKAKIEVMYPHNKLRTPIARAEPDSDALLSQNPPKVSYESFELYMKKYRNAYEVCSYHGVAQYQTKQLVLVPATKFSKLGLAFLLMAAYVGFSTLFKSKPETPPSVFTFMQIFVYIILTLCILIALIAVTSFTTKAEHVLQSGTIMTFILTIWWILALVTVCVVLLSYYQTNTTSTKTFVWEQIAQDVCIIAGLANLGIAFLLQRGESDEYVIATCFILFVVIGVVQHFSNILRMLQLISIESLKESQKADNAQKQAGSSTSFLFLNIAYNRVVVLALVALAMLGYVMLSSFSVQTWSGDVLYSYERARVYAICAFLIFTAFDVFFEVLVISNIGTPAKFNDQHPRKMMWTGWVIIVSLFILHLQEYFALCASSDSERPSCNLFTYFFSGPVQWLA